MSETIEADLKNIETHFKFGDNWSEYAKKISDDHIKQACSDLARLLGTDNLTGLSFLDIGCGSGIHSLAALKLGAANVVSIDLDDQSVATTQRLLLTHAPHKEWKCEKITVFDLNKKDLGRFDIVYSWGVLHHTGDMWEAINQAQAIVKDNGLLALALYQKTPLCNFWLKEKRVYTKSPKWAQIIIRSMFKVSFILGLIATGRNPVSYIRNYYKNRGMSWSNDVHDWLGGYPYQSVSFDDLQEKLKKLDLTCERKFLVNPRLHGLFGTGCDEYTFKRTPSQALAELP